jgi:hypothetical protein
MNRDEIERKRTTFRIAAHQNVICMGSEHLIGVTGEKVTIGDHKRAKKGEISSEKGEGSIPASRVHKKPPIHSQY